jgi:hypothetical protein
LTPGQRLMTGTGSLLERDEALARIGDALDAAAAGNGLESAERVTAEILHADGQTRKAGDLVASST